MPVWVYTTLIPGSIVFWFLMLALVSYAGGWSALAREYREDALTVADGPSWHFQSGSLRKWCGYNGCLAVVSGETGLRLSVWAMFRPAHPPLFLPYDEMQFEELSTMGIKRTRVRMQRVPSITIDLAPRVLEPFRGTDPEISAND